MKASIYHSILTLAVALLAVACSDSDEDDLATAFLSVEASEVYYTSATLSSYLGVVSEEVSEHGFSCHVASNGASPRTIELGSRTQAGVASTRITGLTPGTTYRYYYYARTASQIITSEYDTFTTPDLPIDEMTFSPEIGTGNTLITLHAPGVWDRLTDDDYLAIIFNVMVERRVLYQEDIQKMGPDSIRFPAPDSIFVPDLKYEEYKIPIGIKVNHKSYLLGYFQYASPYFLSPETLRARPGEEIRVITQHESPESSFSITGLPLPRQNVQPVAEGTYEHTLILPSNLTPGRYEVEALTPPGHPMAVLPGQTAVVTVVE